jgi:hypothetical protein
LIPGVKIAAEQTIIIDNTDSDGQNIAVEGEACNDGTTMRRERAQDWDL